MRVEMYTVFDSAVKAYLPPFYARARGEALRSFMEACNDPTSNFSKHAQDYRLFYLGDFDDGSGVFTPAGPSPVFVLAAEQAIKPEGVLT